MAIGYYTIMPMMTVSVGGGGGNGGSASYLAHWQSPVEHTQASVYQAITQAAQHIEEHPDQYNFQATEVPLGGNGIGCMLGRIAALHGGKFTNADAAASALLDISATQFFADIAEVMLGRTPDFHCRADFDVLHEAKRAAQALRVFADRYRPAHIGLPAVVKAIFERENDHAAV